MPFLTRRLPWTAFADPPGDHCTRCAAAPSGTLDELAGAEKAPTDAEPAGHTPLDTDPVLTDPVTEGIAPAPCKVDVEGEQGWWATPGVVPPTVPVAVSPRVAGLQDAIGAMVEGGVVSGSRADTEALLRLAEQARAVALRELAEMDATGGHLRPDARATTTGSWLRDALRLGDAAARGMVRTAVRLRDELPALGALLADGVVTMEHAQAALAGVRGLDPQVIADASDGICALASLVDPASARRILRDKAVAVSPQLAEEAARRSLARQGLRVSEVGDHTAIDGTLSGENGELLRRALDLGTEKARADGDLRGRAARNADVLLEWARDALAREHGPGMSLREDAHTIRTHLHVLVTPDQLADAARSAETASGEAPVAEAFEQAPVDRALSDPLGTGASCPGEGSWADFGDSPERLTALAGQLSRDLLGQHFSAALLIVGSRTPLTQGALRRLACDATLHLTVQHDLRRGGDGEHVCYERPPALSKDLKQHRSNGSEGQAGPDGWLCSHVRDPLYVGRSTRTVTGAQYKALVARDRHCVVAGCEQPPAACDGHHVVHWLDGGLTDLDNLVLLCRKHHHDHHDRGQDLPHRDRVRWITQDGWRTLA